MKASMARRRVVHRDCSYVEKDPFRGRAKQEFKRETDLNFLIAKYRKLGVWPSGSPEVFDDQASWPKDLAEAFAITAKATEQFAALPAQVRRRLGNDPTRLLELQEDDLQDIRKYLKRQEGPKDAPVGEGSGGSRPPEKEAKPPKKPAPKAPKVEEDDQE